MRSTARLFGKQAVLISFGFHLGAAALIALAAYAQGAGRLGALTALAFLAHGAWQAFTLKTSGEAKALAMFKANVQAGSIVAIGFLIAAAVPQGSGSRIYADHETVPPAVDMPFGLKPAQSSAPRSPYTWLASDLEKALAAEADKRSPEQ